MSSAPIALFTFNRLDHMTRTVETLRANHLASESDLFIFCDGPRHADEKMKTDIVREYARAVTGFRSVNVVERPTNSGLSVSLIAGITELIERFGKVIVVEDDLETSEYFLAFMNDALVRYHDDDRVGCIHGYVYPLMDPMPAPFFLRGGDCWGWATWKRSWDLFESDGQKLLSIIKRRNLQKIFDYEGTFPFTLMLSDQIKGKNNSWAIRWTASLFLAEKLCLYPNRSLVRNIGLDGSGVHCSIDQVGSETTNESLLRQTIDLDRVEVTHSEVAYHKFSRYFIAKKPKRRIFRALLNRVRMMQKRLISVVRVAT